MKSRRVIYTGTKYLPKTRFLLPDDPLAVSEADQANTADESFDLFFKLAAENQWSTDFETYQLFCSTHDLPALDQDSFNNKFTLTQTAKSRWKRPTLRRAPTRRLPTDRPLRSLVRR